MNRDQQLSGLRVIDFSAVYAGPICTRFLSDCGADVVKIEPPRGGDLVRGLRGTNRMFEHFNAGKRSVGINLNDAEGQRIARSLVDGADVLVENYRPGIMKRFGLDYDSLKDDHPNLVYCSISGFGQTGPFAQRAAYAPIAHASSGFDSVFMSAQPAGLPPPVSNIMIADMVTGSYALSAILTALLGRNRSGRGDYIDVTMIESMMMLIPAQIQTAQLDRTTPAGGFWPIRVRDGFVMICIVSEKNLRTLCEAMGRPDMLTDERFQIGARHKNMEAFIAEIESWTTQFDARTCETRLAELGVPCSVYNEPSDLFSHPQLNHRETFAVLSDDEGEFRVPRVPWLFQSGATPPTEVAPLLGEHTRAIVSPLIGDDAYARLAAAGVLSTDAAA